MSSHAPVVLSTVIKSERTITIKFTFNMHSITKKSTFNTK